MPRKYGKKSLLFIKGKNVQTFLFNAREIQNHMTNMCNNIMKGNKDRVGAKSIVVKLTTCYGKVSIEVVRDIVFVKVFISSDDCKGLDYSIVG